MTTVDKQFADQLIALNGQYEDDRPIYTIVAYTNAWGGPAYGLNYIWGSDLGRYTESPFVQNPTIYWKAQS